MRSLIFSLIVVIPVHGQGNVVPKFGTFPKSGEGVYLTGELVSVDHVNRRGAIRLAGDGVDDKYHWAPGHKFAMLPYGSIRYRGAPAELRDIPIGTVVHGYFLRPETTPLKTSHPYILPFSDAISIEDDFSFYQRHGQSWKIQSIDLAKGKLKVTSEGTSPRYGLKGEQTFDIDPSTRIWQGRQIAELDDLATQQVVQLNLAWSPHWVHGQYGVSDIWIDKNSRDTATETQRKIHVKHTKSHWLPGWVDAVEHEPGGRGVVTVTLFAGYDPSFYDLVRIAYKTKHYAVLAVAEPTLRTWWQEHDSKHGPILEYKEIPDPPPGSSGMQVKIKIDELLEGFRPGRIVRLATNTNGFSFVKLPPEERVKSVDDR